MSVYQSFLSYLDEAIAASGSATRLASLLGVAPSLLTRWRNRQRIPSLDTIEPLANYIGLELRKKIEGGREQVFEKREPEHSERELKKRIRQLEEKIEELKEYKIKWEGHIESLRAQHCHYINDPGGRERR